MRIESAIVCDDIRKEETGKFILIGVYQENILFETFPGNVSLQVWVEFYVDRNGEIPIEVRILRNKRTIRRGSAGVEVFDYKKQITLPLPKTHIVLDDECTLTFQIRETDKRWHTLKKLSIGLKD